MTASVEEDNRERFPVAAPSGASTVRRPQNGTGAADIRRSRSHIKS